MRFVLLALAAILRAPSLATADELRRRASGCDDICGIHGVCTPLPADEEGQFRCDCDVGFEGEPGIDRAPAFCADINGCIGNECGANQVCSDAPAGRPYQYTCTCAEGYDGDRVLDGPTSCVHRCATVECGTHASCSHLPIGLLDPDVAEQAATAAQTMRDLGGSTLDAERAASGAAAAAYRSRGASEVDIEQAEHEAARRARGAGAFLCTCDDGYDGDEVTGAATTCVDSDGCKATDCGANAKCIDLPDGSPEGRFKCACAAGYTGAGVVDGPAVCTAGGVTPSEASLIKAEADAAAEDQELEHMEEEVEDLWIALVVIVILGLFLALLAFSSKLKNAAKDTEADAAGGYGMTRRFSSGTGVQMPNAVDEVAQATPQHLASDRFVAPVPTPNPIHPGNASV